MFPGGIGMYELIVFAIIAVILFGSRLPEVARNVGRTYSQFRKSLSDIQASFKIDESSSSSSKSEPSYSDRYDDYEEPVAPKFDPPPEED